MLDFSAGGAALRILNEFKVPKRPALKFYGFQNSLKSKLGVGLLKMRGSPSLVPAPRRGSYSPGQVRPSQSRPDWHRVKETRSMDISMISMISMISSPGVSSQHQTSLGACSWRKTSQVASSWVWVKTGSGL